MLVVDASVLVVALADDGPDGDSACDPRRRERYDASYVALAERLGATLLTADVRLTRATGPNCTIEDFT